jgi:predicted nucleic acid-binding protein
VTVFLDSSTLLAASWSAKGCSQQLVAAARENAWDLITADYCLSEVERNVRRHRTGATDWRRLVRPRLRIIGSVYVIDRPLVFERTKDRPVLLSAIASNADYLVTLDTTDFGHLLGTVVYGVKVRAPRAFLAEMGWPG